MDPLDHWVSLIQYLPKINVALAKSEIRKGGISMVLNRYPIPDCGELEPDAYDANGNLTINSWELFKEDELARELDNQD